MLPPAFDASIFALETSTPHASMALSVSGSIVSKREWTAERSHNSRIFDLLKDMKEVLDVNPPKLILVGSGPGSYSGVRVALAVADGLALAYGARVVAVPSLEALPIEEDLAMVLSDARRGGWAIADIVKGEMKEGIRIVRTDEVSGIALSIKERGGELLSCEEASKLEEKGWRGFRAGLVPRAESIIAAWLSKSLESQSTLMQAIPAPMYVREPHITEAKRALWEKGQISRKKGEK